MMMSCPKCGFTQPKDQYCAKCGIDMLAYKPAEPPLSRKLLSNWLVQIAILTVLLTSVYAFFNDRSRTEDQLVEMIEDGSSGHVIEQMTAPVRDRRPAHASDSNETATTPDPSASTPPSASAGDRDPSSTAADETRPRQNEDALAAHDNTSDKRDSGSDDSGSSSRASEFFKAAESSVGDGNAAGRTDSVTTVQKLRIIFAEIPRPIAADLLGNARNVSSDSTLNFNAGIVPDLSSRLQNAFDSTTYLLEAASEYPVRINQPIVIFKGTRDVASEQNIGLTTQITPVSNDENGVQLQVEVTRVLREPAGANPDPGLSYQETFMIAKEGGVFLAGLLPRRQMNEEETRFYAGAGVLRVMNSHLFQANNSEFIIFIEAQ